MVKSSVRGRGAAWLVGAVAGSAYLAAFALAMGASKLPSPSVVFAALTIDLVVTVPLAFYWFVVRRYGLRKVYVVPVIVLGFIAASFIIPDAYQSALTYIRILAVPVELGLLIWIFTRAHRTVRRARAETERDIVAAFRESAFGFTGSERAADIIATEASALYFALLSWRTCPHIPSGSKAVGIHVRSGHGGIVLGFALLIMVEIVPMHLLVGLWSSVAAWILTIGSFYAIVILVGDYRATVLRPVLITDNSIVVRAGIRWECIVAIEQVAGVTQTRPASSESTIDLMVGQTASHWLMLTEPIEMRGMYGIRRTVRSIGILPDDPETLRESLHTLPT